MAKSNDVNAFYIDAAFQAVKGLLYRQFYDVNTGQLTDPSIASDTAIQALNKAIAHGGGHTLRPHIGSYWMVVYWPGIKVSLTRSEGENNIEEKVSRSLIIQIAEKCLTEYKWQTVQLSLF